MSSIFCTTGKNNNKKTPNPVWENGLCLISNNGFTSITLKCLTQRLEHVWGECQNSNFHKSLARKKMAGWAGRSIKEPSLVFYLTGCYKFQLTPIPGLSALVWEYFKIYVGIKLLIFVFLLSLLLTAIGCYCISKPSLWEAVNTLNIQWVNVSINVRKWRERSAPIHVGN